MKADVKLPANINSNRISSIVPTQKAEKALKWKTRTINKIALIATSDVFDRAVSALPSAMPTS